MNGIHVSAPSDKAFFASISQKGSYGSFFQSSLGLKDSFEGVLEVPKGGIIPFKI